MKLIDLTISAFGALRDYHLDFEDGITAKFEENGFGKTTLAAFIKAMFYSFPTARKTQSADSSERAKYYPFGGGNYGGRLTFEVGGRQYRIIRSFDRYSITGDSFELIDAKTGKPSSDYSENIGAELFGVDENGFEKSTFSNGEADFSLMPSSIRNKISAVTDSADDMDEFESAKNLLSKAIKDLEGKNGKIDLSKRSIYSAKTDIERLEKEDEEFKRISGQIKDLSDKKVQLEKEKSRISDIISAKRSAEATEIKKENYAKLLAKCEDLNAKIQSLKAKYSGKIPENAEVSALSQKIEDYSKSKILKAEEQKRLQNPELKAISELFENDFPTDEEMGSIQTQIRLIDKYTDDIERAKQKKASFSQELSSFSIPNAENIPDDAELSRIRTLSTAPAAATSTKTSPIFIILSAIMLAAGVGLVFVNMIVGIAVAAVGAVALIASLLLNSVKKMVSGAPTNAGGYSAETREFLVKFGFSPDADINAAVDKLREYQSLKDEIVSCDYEIESSQQSLFKALELCWQFMDAFAADRQNSPSDEFEKLRRNRERYLFEIAPSKDKEKEISSALARLENEILEFLTQIGAEKTLPDNFELKLSEIKLDISEFERLEKELAVAQSETKEAKESLGEQTEFATESEVSLEELTAALENTEAAISEISSKIPELNLSASRLSQSRERINELEEAIENENEATASYELKLKNLKNALEFLEKAKDELSKKYSKGLNESFSKYSAMFFDKDISDARLDSELSLSIEREGIGRIPEFFSSGQKSVMDVCLRLSLIEAMFEKEKPFIILDDPFASLDEKNLKSALNLLKEASSEFQIIYLTCHESRMIK